MNYIEQPSTRSADVHCDGIRSIDGLATIVQAQLQLDPYSTALFLFCDRRCDRIKGLLWKGVRFLLLYKGLDNGKFQWLRNETEALLLTTQ